VIEQGLGIKEAAEKLALLPSTLGYWIQQLKAGIKVLNLDINKSSPKCTIESNAISLRFLSVLGLGEATAQTI
jgi:DNA polymerase III alpha subunit